MKALDIETKSLVPTHPEYALQPWRVKTGEATISVICIGDDRTAGFVSLEQLKRLKGGTFVCWNTVFDAAFLYAAGLDIDRFTWYDAMLVEKWCSNSQDPSIQYSLAATAARRLQGWKYIKQFLKLKANEQDQGHDKYWEIRAKLDVQATYLIMKQIESIPSSSWKIEAGNIVPNAKAWVHGVPTNPKNYTAAIPELSAEMCEIECRLGVCNTGKDRDTLKHWTPSTILRSSKQLQNLLYDVWKLPCTHYTDKGARAVSKTALTYLADKDPKIISILQWRSLNTLLTKFCQSPQKAAKYLKSNILHPEPKIFSTYTGRYTYASKSDGKYPIAMALHQIPRGPKVRSMVESDKILVELDASGQEARLLAEIGNVESMLEVFRQGKKTHAVMGAAIAGISYDEFMKRYKSGQSAYAGPEGLYYCGKFVGLSMQYRVGALKHRIMARVQYGLDKDETTIKRWRSLYHHTYPEVQQYWKDAVKLAKSRGYAETLAGRRYKLDRWYGEFEWKTSSSAINFPIQGSGGDMKNLAITTIAKKFPELEFAWDLHDGLFYWVERSKAGLQAAVEARETLNNLDYYDAWGWKPRIPMPWDIAVGTNWGAMREL
jgi:hypothetical protein